MKKLSIKKISSLSLFLALAILLNYIENFLPILIPLPGFKIGLANTMNIIILYFYGKKEFFSIGLLRVILISLLFNGLFSYSFMLSLSGFLLSSITVLLLSKSNKLSIYSLSICSSIFHSIGQIICATIIYSTPYIFVYLSLLTLISTITGLLIALVSSMLISRLEKITFFSSL